MKTKRPPLTPRRIKRSLGTAAVVLVLLAGSVIMVMPFYWMVITSFKARHEVLVFPIRWLPTTWHFENYAMALKQGNFARYFFNSMYVATIVVVARLVTGSFIGYGLAKYQYPVLKAFFIFILGTMMIPGDVLLIPFYLVMKRLGWIDTYMALTMADLVGAFDIFLMRQVCLDIPDELIDAARVDGCSELGIWSRIVIPNVKPGLITLAIFDFLLMWNSFYWPLLVIGKDELRTLPLALSLFQNRAGTQYHWLMAICTLMTLPSVLLFLSLQRYYMASITMSGLKL